YVNWGDTFYYLTPWIDKKEISIKNIYECIGNIHYKTKNTFPINKKDFINSFQRYKSDCESIQRKLLTIIQTYEAKRFMSPFELQFCMHYHEVSLAVHQLIDRLEKLKDSDADMN